MTPDKYIMKHCGFTLIELMTVVAIIAIISFFAYPSYQRYVDRAIIEDARTALLSTAHSLERCYSTNNSYTGCVAGIPAVDRRSTYTITYTVNGQTFAAFAGRSGGDCSLLSIDQTGTTLPAECW